MNFTLRNLIALCPALAAIFLLYWLLPNLQVGLATAFALLVFCLAFVLLPVKRS